jgi:hypothetical protein
VLFCCAVTSILLTTQTLKELASHRPCTTTFFVLCLLLEVFRPPLCLGRKNPCAVFTEFLPPFHTVTLIGVQAAVLGKDYVCPIHPDTPLPMMYMPDCLRATWLLITAPREVLTRCTYNVTAMSFTPAQLEASIRNCYPGFKVRVATPASSFMEL